VTSHRAPDRRRTVQTSGAEPHAAQTLARSAGAVELCEVFGVRPIHRRAGWSQPGGAESCIDGGTCSTVGFPREWCRRL